jgi:hypothetical protein
MEQQSQKVRCLGGKRAVSEPRETYFYSVATAYYCFSYGSPKMRKSPFSSGLDSVHGHTGVGLYGHARMRTMLYLATLSAARHNPAVKAFYDRLRARGKAPKVARCAAARKLLHIAWAVATKGEPFDPHYHMREHHVVAAT